MASLIPNIFDSINVNAGAVIPNIENSLTNQLTSSLRNFLSPTPLGTSSVVNSGGWLSRALNRVDPLLDVDWDVDMPDGFPSEFIETIHAPLPDFDVSNAIFRGGRKFYLAQHPTIGSLRMTIYEDRLMSGLIYLWGWKGQIQNDDGTHNYPNLYKKTISVYPTDSTGRRLLQLKYNGCFPFTLPAIQFVSQTTGRITYQVEIKVDYLEIFS